ncbi:MAG TPA: hypothetical protein VFD60_03165, partial [Nitrososphaeraceae archaeon]|nr:hypothetical protein [Nitrososphaeraceae archaeon]
LFTICSLIRRQYKIIFIQIFFHILVVRQSSLYLYFNSRSYRFAGKSLEPIIKRTHVSIWKWVQKYSILLADRFVIGKRKVQKIFVDETLPA